MSIVSLRNANTLEKWLFLLYGKHGHTHSFTCNEEKMINTTISIANEKNSHLYMVVKIIITNNAVFIKMSHHVTVIDVFKLTHSRGQEKHTLNHTKHESQKHTDTRHTHTYTQTLYPTRETHSHLRIWQTNFCSLISIVYIICITLLRNADDDQFLWVEDTWAYFENWKFNSKTAVVFIQYVVL